MNNPDLNKLSAEDRLAIRLIGQDGHNVITRLAAEQGVTRQAASKRLQRLAAAGLIAASGHTRGKVYMLRPLEDARATYKTKGLFEDAVWRELCAPVVADLPENVRDAWHYGITEMVNNAIDHSGSEVITVAITKDALYTSAVVADAGEGIFLKIQKALGLYDPREAMLELAKGKFTTDPKRHSGEGIFFASKIFEHYEIRSGNLVFHHDDGGFDILAEADVGGNGTTVIMRLPNDWPRSTKEIFDDFAGPDSYTFDSTIVPVRLAAHEGEKLVSRSQAKRLTMRFEKFRHVILDFEGVSEIGQAFADEVFRVFANAHPNTVIVPIHMEKHVEDMVKRSLAARADAKKE